MIDIKSMASGVLANYVDAINSVIATQACSKYPNQHKIGNAMEQGLTAMFAAQKMIDMKGEVAENSFFKTLMTAMQAEQSKEADDPGDRGKDAPPVWAQQIIDDNKAIKAKLKI